MTKTLPRFPVAILLCLMPATHLQGATLAGQAAGDSMVYVIERSDLIGPAASGVSAIAGSGMVCVNNFNIFGQYSTITDVTLQWGLILGTTQFTAGIWSDPNQDGIPDDAVLLATSALAPAIAGSYLQQVHFASPQYIGLEGTSFFVGVYWRESSQPGVDLFMGKDRPLLNAWPSWSKKWTNMPPDPSNLNGAHRYDGTHRAFVIRPTGVVPEPASALLFAMATLALTIQSRRRR